ncbi:hypothetical protein HNQ85_001306 [Anoxybacillus calidus]|jgi:hypothetical protein|uniref:Uncharacterized protein n=1 Tax=[Anoxybacillus] calidus TaxID=575178 RepID=A0A7V9YZ64_9BACL|nr:hypothetical protein [Anoxybacillus calidus]MBA2871036.1 hypothetical protein [Anoxybacillus calidus]
MENLFRDFIYMDIERLKSIVAQLNEGLTEATTKVYTEGDQNKYNVNTSFLNFLKAGGESTYLWQNQSTESQTLHDYIYNLAEKLLLEKKLLIRIPEELTEEEINNPSEKNYKITPTSFILVRGKSIINDYIYMQRILENYNDIVKAVVSGHISSNPEYANYSPKDKEKLIKQQARENELPKEIKDSLLTFINNFFQNRIVFKCVPFINNPDFRFAGPLNPSFLRERIEDLIFKYGTAPKDEWYMFAQIASIPHSAENTIDISEHQNEIEKGLQQVFDALRVMEKSGLSISFPEISVTPIAIYRQ